VGGLFPAVFKAWDEQIVRAERAERRISELQGRPDVTLDCSAVSRLKTLTQGQGRSDQTLYAFTVHNSGPGQAVSVSIHDIVLPMAEHIKRETKEQYQQYETQGGVALGPRKPGWDKWIVHFQTITSIASGEEADISHSISNIGGATKAGPMLGSCEHCKAVGHLHRSAGRAGTSAVR
jgi:hypothetical protein